MYSSEKPLVVKYNSSYIMLLLLCIGALFIKNPKFYGIAITDVALAAGIITAFTYRYPVKIKVSSLLLLALALLFILYEGLSIIKVPDKLRFLLYYARVIKSFIVGVLGFTFFRMLSTPQQHRVLKFFFILAIVTIFADTVYSLYHFSNKSPDAGMWSLYSALKVSYLYADKNMVAFTISLLMVLSNRFFNQKYLFLLWFLTIVSLSRSGILINTLLLMYFMGFKLLRPSVLIMLFCTLVLSVILIFALDLDHMFAERLSLTKDLSMQGRMGLQQMGINMWLDAPLTGQGLSGFEQKFYDFYQGGEETPFPHNFYIYILAEEGLIGFMLLALVFALLWLRLHQNGLGVLLAAYFMFGMFLFNLSEYHFFFLVGMLLAYNSNPEQLENRILSTIPG